MSICLFLKKQGKIMPRFIRQILVARIEFDLSNISHYAVLDMTEHHRIFSFFFLFFFFFFFLQIQFICWPLVYSYFLISFRMDWLDLLAVQGTLKSLLQHHSSKASTLQSQLSSQSNSHIHT